MTLQATLIISFYNKIEWLRLVLAACEQQSQKDFEIIIADDGSRDEVVKQIEDIVKNSGLSIQHLWHPDRGFTKTIMLNKAIVAAKSEYLIFIDGDCIPHKHFVKDHCRLRKPNQLLAGRRVNLSDGLTKKLTAEGIRKGQLTGIFLIRLFMDSLFGESRDVEKGIHIGIEAVNQKFGNSRKGVLGCNFSIEKRAMVAVNGFDERYVHPGVGEDTEIEFRLRKNGINVWLPKFCLVQYHLWHKRLSREQEPANLMLFADTKNSGYIKTPYGIDKS